MAAVNGTQSFEEMKALFESRRQGQVFRFAASLTAEQKQQLVSQLRNINLDEVERMYASVKSASAADAKAETVTPFDGTTDAISAPAAVKASWYNTGLTAIANGQVGALLLAGGQGTRLGYNHPKGMYDIGLPSKKSLFELQAGRIQRLRVLAATLVKKDVKDVHLPWYVMTSGFTHEETLEYFKSKNYFGLPPNDVMLFSQGTNPCLSNDGKILMQTPSEVATAPDGNGGVYAALLSSGALDHMEKLGIKHVHLYGVDNCCVKVADPSFIGFCIEQKTDCCNKVLAKRGPHEKVGVMCRRNGVPSVIEYSEITKEMAEQVDDKGALVYGAANVAMHAFTVDFLRKCTQSKLPFHSASKAIPCVNDKGETVAPESNNGVKLEMFVFDVFAFADKCTAFQVSRQGEFSPLKNAPGSAADSPESCRKELSEYHQLLAERAGATVVAGGPGDVFEISPAVTYDGEGLEHVKGKTFKAPVHIEA